MVLRFTNICTFNLVQPGQTANSSRKFHFGCLNSRSQCLIHDPTLMAISQNRNIDCSKMDSFALVQSSRFSTTDRRSWRITALAFPMQISKSLFYLPSLVNETPRYLNFSDCFSSTPSIWREHCFGCQDRHMVSVFVVLVFNLASEHASENLSRACW